MALAFALAIATSTAGTSAAPPPDPPAARTLKVLSYNAYGAVRGPRKVRVCSRPHGSGAEVCRWKTRWGRPFDGVDHAPFRFVDVLAGRIAAERPQLVALQEMCGSQVNHLERALASRGYPMAVQFVGSPNSDARCPTSDGRWPSQRVGKAALAAGPATPERHSPLVNVCLRYESGIPIRFCSIHTAPEEDGGTLRTAARTLNGLAEQGAVIVAGDFNAEPMASAMDSMYKGDDNDPRGRGSFYEPDTAAFCVLGECGRAGGPTNRGLIGKKIDYVFADAEHFEKPVFEKRLPPETSPTPQAWVEDTDGQCGGEACSDHHMLWGKVTLIGADFADLEGLWIDLGDGPEEAVHEIDLFRISADGSISDLSLYAASNRDAEGRLVYSSGRLVERGDGRYSATLQHNRYDISLRYQFEVIDCAAATNRFPRCLESPDPGPIELHVTGDYGYQSMYRRLKCNGAAAPPDLPPQPDAYARPCD